MCGISGIFRFDKRQVSFEVANKINQTLVHRGPDAGSVKLFDFIALGHRRLSIIDLSSEANQPMATEDQRYHIVFNGEIYNFKEIRQELMKLGVSFQTHSDTEVVLKSFQVWNNRCFEKFNGMFALAILDRHKNQLTLARDAFGIKPLYFFKNKDLLVFGSEIKAILPHPDVSTSLNKQALSEYLWYGNPLGNNTFYNEIKELSAGCFMSISEKATEENSYYNLPVVTSHSFTEQEAIEQIRYLFDASVKRHLISDVPVGVFLSGGIDSSAITAYATKHYSGKLNTYSVGFDFTKGPNELIKAADIAKKFNTNHHEIHIAGTNVIESIEALAHAHDEPFGDAANIPLYLLTKQLKGSIKVVLQGDGGDEFFGGYSRYKTMHNRHFWKLAKPLAELIRFSKLDYTRLLQLQRFINAIGQSNPALRNALLLTMESKYTNPFQVLNPKYRNEIKNYNPFARYNEVYENYSTEIDPVQALFYTDSQIILKDTFLEKVDRATMANSMEIRVPFLDKELTEFMLRLPAEIKVKSGVQKYLIKKAMEGVIPNDILYGKKTGFSVPYGYWLQTSLADYFIEQISTERSKAVLDVNKVSYMFQKHKNNQGNYGFLLWKVLNLAIWLNKSQTAIYN
jgi:asparagine synthase (glutamine-hydrolysing)